MMSEADAFGTCITPIANSRHAFVITSNADFNGIPAGQPINSKFWNTKLNAPLDSVIVFDQFAYYEFTLRFREKPAEATHTFTISMEDSAGNKFQFHTEQLIWH